ncbi:MAG: L-histidine N(alpha)-methyltransferase [Hahellaceae bacterium]|nr:L-histidine N(alpha)-methyltransferase [Hahellaceae bacterium]MCP5168255.1 L-histidine N(alpha)-methyltransferase [Hahellaceae bacterium]
MTTYAAQTSSRIEFIDLQPQTQNIITEVLEGLRHSQKRISPKFFYDERGSQLFEAITRQPEYYPTRTETQILSENAEAIAARIGAGFTLIEPGCGSCEKVRLLLDALQPETYVAMDISSRFLINATQRLAEQFPWLGVTAVCGDFSQLGVLDAKMNGGRRVAFYPGSTLGNFDPSAALAFLKQLRALVGEHGGLLIGVDQDKDAQILHAAYNDAHGITADFNQNVLHHLNRLLPADFEVENFSHEAFYNADQQRIEMHLRSLCSQTVSCADTEIRFDEGETIHTENSYKYTPASFTGLARAAGFRVQQEWCDAEQLFAVYYCEAA